MWCSDLPRASKHWHAVVPFAPLALLIFSMAQDARGNEEDRIDCRFFTPPLVPQLTASLANMTRLLKATTVVFKRYGDGNH